MNDQMSTIIPLVLWSGFFTMCIVQFLKPFTRLIVHRAVLNHWLARLTGKPLGLFRGPEKSRGSLDKIRRFGRVLSETFQAPRRTDDHHPVVEVPKSIEAIPSEQFCGYIAQSLSRRLENDESQGNLDESPRSFRKEHRDYKALQRVDELLANIRRRLELVIEIEVLVLALGVFAALYSTFNVDFDPWLKLIALPVAAYSATIFRDLVGIIEKLKR